MPAEPNSGVFDQIAQKWRDLAERRRAYFMELYRTGRWQRYYTEDQFRSRVRDVLHAAKRWDELARRRKASGNDVPPAA
ncbi:MAG TPA: TIGR03809 family protein [Pseudolabrys sp.]|nr:TIGR03809 family protein [Pseudolabrys sp.]